MFALGTPNNWLIRIKPARKIENTGKIVCALQFACGGKSFVMNESSNESTPKRGRGRPRKPSNDAMLQRNVSLTPQDDAALRRLVGKLQLTHFSLSGEAAEGISSSWAIRALIRFADRKTRDWTYSDVNDFLQLVGSLGMIDDPYKVSDGEN